MTAPQFRSLDRPADAGIEHALQTIRQALGTMHYGTIALTVHNERIVQLDITEKRRFGP